jgi:serine/threonine protein kinase
VYEGSATDLRVRQQSPIQCGAIHPVAIKMLHATRQTSSQRASLLDEARRMSNLRHSNVVQLLAVCFNSPPHFIVLELMRLGDLKSVLRKCKDMQRTSSQFPFAAQHQLYLSLDVSSGVEFLAAQKFVHRDIAARNILVNDHWVAKIGDFGL